MKNDHMFQDANIISLNETHLGHSNTDSSYGGYTYKYVDSSL